MVPDRFRTAVFSVVYILSAAVFVLWPARLPVPPGAGGWALRAIDTLAFPTAAAAVVVHLRRMRQKNSLRGNFERFEGTYERILDAVVVLMAGTHLTILAYLTAGRVWLGSIIPILLGGTIAYAGNLLPRLRPNAIIGIRTPWTLRDHGVWMRTHRIAGYGFVLWGFLLMAAAVFSFPLTWVVFVAGAAALLIGLSAASCLLWRSRPAATAGSSGFYDLPLGPSNHDSEHSDSYR